MANVKTVVILSSKMASDLAAKRGSVTRADFAQTLVREAREHARRSLSIIARS